MEVGLARFLPRDAMLARYMLAYGTVSVCVSVSLCLSQVGVLPKQVNVGSNKQHHTIAEGL